VTVYCQEISELLDALDRVVRFRQLPEVRGWTDRHPLLWRRARHRFGDLEVGEAGEFTGYPVGTLLDPNIAAEQGTAHAERVDELPGLDLL
jgi:hypothetical protein